MLIIETENEIERITVGVGESEMCCDVGPFGFDRIEPYQENGEMASVVWFNLIKDNKVVSKVSSKFVSCIDYKK